MNEFTKGMTSIQEGMTTIFKGMAEAFTPKNEYTSRYTKLTIDQEAIKSDWEKTVADMKTAMDQFSANMVEATNKLEEIAKNASKKEVS